MKLEVQRCTFISIRLIGPPGEQFRQTSLDRRAIAWTYIAFGRLEPGTIYVRGYTGRVCNRNKCAKLLRSKICRSKICRSKVCAGRRFATAAKCNFLHFANTESWPRSWHNPCLARVLPGRPYKHYACYLAFANPNWITSRVSLGSRRSRTSSGVNQCAAAASPEAFTSPDIRVQRKSMST